MPPLQLIVAKTPNQSSASSQVATLCRAVISAEFRAQATTTQPAMHPGPRYENSAMNAHEQAWRASPGLPFNEHRELAWIQDVRAWLLQRLPSGGLRRESHRSTDSNRATGFPRAGPEVDRRCGPTSARGMRSSGCLSTTKSIHRLQENSIALVSPGENGRRCR